MKDLSIMTPAELQLAVNQIEQSLYMDKGGEVFFEKAEVVQLKAIKKEILEARGYQDCQVYWSSSWFIQ